jgi:hypothetical protein
MADAFYVLPCDRLLEGAGTVQRPSDAAVIEIGPLVVKVQNGSRDGRPGNLSAVSSIGRFLVCDRHCCFWSRNAFTRSGPS